jgi:methyl-accepting chemotaxis protein
MVAFYLQSSLSQIAQREGGVKFVRAFYERLFSTYPQVQPLFASTDMEAQAQKLYEALEYVALGYENRTESFAKILRQLGQRHKAYGVKPAHYRMVGKVLLETMAECLGSAWTPAVEKAWQEAYDYVVQQMLMGYDG